MKEDAINASPIDPQRDLGPDLKPLGWWPEHGKILMYILKHHGIKISIVILAIVALVYYLHAWDELYPSILSQKATIAEPVSPTSWTGWLNNLQSYLAIGTFFVALFVWYGKIRDDWQEELPKRMSVFFLHNGLPVIVCRYVWLAGEGDLRAWGQQVAAQAVGERFLSFYPNVRLEAPRKALWIDGKICRHYEVCFELMDMDKKKNQNLFLEKYAGECRYQNMATGSNIVSSVPIADLKNRIKAEVFPFNWPEKSNPGLSDTGI
jgi:hypothetical protein